MSTDSTDPDLQDRLDRSFGDGPEHRPLPGTLAAGRRALRRRRQLGSAATVAVVAAVAVAGWGVTGSARDHRTEVAPATAPGSADATTGNDELTEQELQRRLEQKAAERRRIERERQRLVSREFPAALDSDGTLVVKDGWRVTRRVPNPVGYAEPEQSLGVIVTDGEQTRWMLLTLRIGYNRDGQPDPSVLNGAASADDAGTAYSRYEDWLASMVELDGGSRVDPLVRYVDGELVAGPGARLMEVRPSPVVDGYTAAGDQLAKVERDGRTWFAVVRGGASGDVVPVDAEVLPKPTFEALVDYLRVQAGSGEGLR